MTCGGATGVVSYPKTRSKVPKFGLDGKRNAEKTITYLSCCVTVEGAFEGALAGGDAFEALRELLKACLKERLRRLRACLKNCLKLCLKARALREDV
jgi:hypothetical protein